MDPAERHGRQSGGKAHMTRQACGRFTRRRFVLGGATAGAGLAVTRFRLAQAQATPQPAGELSTTTH